MSADEEADVEGNAERPQRYSLGACHPIYINEVLNNTCRIEHKHGHGDFCTVWLARDIEKESMQKKIRNGVQGTSNIVIYRTAFSLPDCKGSHQVQVFPVRGPKFRSQWLTACPLRQLLMALE